MIVRIKDTLLILSLLLLMAATGCCGCGSATAHAGDTVTTSDAPAAPAPVTLADLGYPETKDGLLLQRKAYVACYSPDNLIPNWVA